MSERQPTPKPVSRFAVRCPSLPPHLQNCPPIPPLPQTSPPHSRPATSSLPILPFPPTPPPRASCSAGHIHPMIRFEICRTYQTSVRKFPIPQPPHKES